MTKLAPLSSIKILDFSRILAAPLASMILGGGDETRQWNQPSVNGQSCYFLCANRNKKSVAINLKHTEGQELARNLARHADVCIENFKTGQMRQFGQSKEFTITLSFSLDYERLSKENPMIVYCSLTDPGYDVIAEAVGGFLSITGPKNTGANNPIEPCKAGVAVVDMITAILAALLAREHSGKGQHIQCNLLASQIAGLLNIGSNYLNAGMVGRPLGTEHESLTPYQAFQTRDGRFYVVGATNDKTFRDLCKSMDLNSLPDMPEFQTYANRMKNREKLIEIFSKRFKEENLKYWKRVLRSQSFPSGAVNNIGEAFEHEQVQHLNLIEAVNHPQYGTVKLTKPPVEFSDSENKIFSPPPLLGEHTEAVLTEVLGLTKAELYRLKKEGIIEF